MKPQKDIAERGIEFFGSDRFAAMILVPGFMFTIGLALYYIHQDLPAGFEGLKAIVQNLIP